jgi:multidrug resistance efflux pump
MERRNEQHIEFADEKVRKITNQIREINYEFKQAEDVKKRDAQLEFERAQVELQQKNYSSQKLFEESQTSVPKDGVQANC